MNTIEKFNSHVMKSYGRYDLVLEKGEMQAFRLVVHPCTGNAVGHVQPESVVSLYGRASHGHFDRLAVVLAEYVYGLFHDIACFYGSPAVKIAKSGWRAGLCVAIIVNLAFMARKCLLFVRQSVPAKR